MHEYRRVDEGLLTVTVIGPDGTLTDGLDTTPE
jgi:hypothetical protein